MPRSRRPFSLYKKSSSSGPAVWYARFWDISKKKFGATRSTGVLAEGKRERRVEAEEQARAMLPSISFIRPAKQVLLLDYVAGFWSPDSPYVRERALFRKVPLSAYYVKMNHDDVARHLADFSGFQGLTIDKLSGSLIKEWMMWAAERGLKARRINSILQSMRVAIRDAVEREQLKADPFLKVKEAHYEADEKGSLTRQELRALVVAEFSDPRVKLAVLLGCQCAMRRGEVRGLLWKDIDSTSEQILLNHNFVPLGKMKGPKNDKPRGVPIPHQVKDAIDAVWKLSPYRDDNDFVLFNLTDRAMPVSENFFRSGTKEALSVIGIPGDQQKSRNLTFHSMRHTYVTLGRLSGMSNLEVQAVAGHGGDAMTDHYSHAAQVMDFKKVKRQTELIAGPRRVEAPKRPQPRVRGNLPGEVAQEQEKRS